MQLTNHLKKAMFVKQKICTVSEQDMLKQQRVKAGEYTVPVHGVPCTPSSVFKSRCEIWSFVHSEIGQQHSGREFPFYSLDDISVIKEHVRTFLEPWFLLSKTNSNSTEENKDIILLTSEWLFFNYIYHRSLKHQTETMIQVINSHFSVQ